MNSNKEIQPKYLDKIKQSILKPANIISISSHDHCQRLMSQSVIEKKERNIGKADEKKIWYSS